jgi:hypothetical protein
MIIATDNFDMNKVMSLCHDYDGLCAYVRSLVPERYKHLDTIYNNTRYYINLCVLKAKDIPMSKKQEVSKLLTRNIHVVGYTDIYITCYDLEKRISMSRVDKYHKGEGNE